MRLPKEMKEPRGLFPGWLMPFVAGGVLVLITIFLAAVFPWSESRFRVEWDDLPRLRSPGGIWYDGDALTVIGDGEDRVWVEGRRMDQGLLEAAMGRTGGEREVALRFHRHARWSSLRPVLEAAARAGRPSASLAVYRGSLRLKLQGPRPGATVVTLVSTEVADPEGAMARTVEAGRDRIVVRLDLPDDPDVEAVARALECYACEDEVLLDVTR